MLQERVDADELPDVAERLPSNPRVIEPLNEMGVYGGTLQTVLASTDPSWLWMTVTHDHLVTWDPNWSELIPNVAEAVEKVDGGSQYVFTLREGMRWSDGEPFTSDDLVWWYQNVLLNKEITPVVPSSLTAGGEPVVVTANGDYEVTFAFSQANSLFLDELAVHGPPFRLLPRHYLEQFHKDFTEGLPADWASEFLIIIDEIENIDLPVLSPWIPLNSHGDGGRQRWQRNPYYWKVDTEGSQLPYIDEVSFRFFNEPGPLLLAAANGDVDLYQRDGITIPKNRPVLADAQESGNYELLSLKDPNQNVMGICLNLTVADEDKRTMYRKKDFRIGLSHAIDRQEIIDLVYLRQGSPWQTAPRPDAPFYDSDEFGTQYTEYDLQRAVEHMERAGYGEVDGQGRRLGEDGQPIVIKVMCQARFPDMVDALGFVKQTWAELGVDLQIDTISSELAEERRIGNNFDCAVDKGELGYLGLLADPRWLFATAGSTYAPLWQNWYEGGEPSEAPPESMQRAMQIYDDGVVGASDPEGQYEAVAEVIDIARDEFWTMGVALPGDPFCIRSNRLKNVPGDGEMWLSFKAPYPAVTNMTQFYLQSS